MGNFAIEAGKAAVNTGSGILGSIWGLATAGINDRRQLRQQDKLNEQAYEINNRMAEENYEREMRKWHDTNYAAQKAELIKAGLNPGLLYGMSGGGGTTAQSQGGQGVNSGQAPSGGGEAMQGMGMGLMAGMQTRLQLAQIENIKADTENKKAQNPNIGLTGENISASTASIKQGINNQKAVEELTKVETGIAKLQQQFSEGTLEQRIANVATEASRLMAEASSAMTKANIDRVTQETNIKQTRQNLLNSIVANAAMKQAITESAARVNKTEQEIESIIKTRYQSGEYLMLAQQGQNLQQTQMQRDNMYRAIAQETGMGEDIVKMIGGAMLGGAIKGMPGAARTEDTYGEYDGKYYETHKKSY